MKSSESDNKYSLKLFSSKQKIIINEPQKTKRRYILNRETPFANI